MVMSYFGKNVSEERTCEAFIISLFNWNIVDLNAVLVSGVQHNDSVTHTHTHTYIFRFFSFLGCHEIIVPCAIYQALVDYLSYV